MSNDNKLGKFLRDVSNWHWDEFAEAEHNPEYTTNQALIFGLVRACAMQKMDAIKLALNRLDGKLKTPIKIEYPKIFFLYPNVQLPAGENKTQALLPKPDDPLQTERYELSPTEPPEPHVGEIDENDLPSLSLRETLTKMSDYPRELPKAIVELALQTEQWLKHNGPKPEEIPLVKSVVAAHLLILAQSRNIDALNEVFDQIDGKLTETIQILGEDIYITSYAMTAPDGAYLNEHGVMQIEATAAQNLWEEKLKNARRV